jgi:arylsulfatase A-like enzyme
MRSGFTMGKRIAYGWILLLAVAGSAGLPAARVADAQPRRLNVLFLFADDMRADTIAAHGNPHIRTPNLDRLVRGGFSFRGNYIFGGNSGAVCVPSRAMLMSGRTWFNVDAPTLAGARLLPEVLGENGYVTFATGKWHNGQPSWLRAFQRGKTILFGGMSDHTKVPVRDLGADGKLSAERTGEKFSSELFADSAIEFLRTHDGTKPFFAYVAFTAPHDPRQPPPSYREMYYRRLPPLPPNFLPQLPFDNGMMKGGRDENLGAWPRTEKMIRDQLAEYYGLITHLDEQIGRVLAALEQSGRSKDTLVLFAADNGLALGSHGLLGKQNVFEHSMRTPLIVAGPGKSSRAFTYLLDLFPTLCDVLGVRPPAGLEGESLRPLWEGRKSRLRDSVFLPYLQIQRAVRDDRWKLIAYPKIGHLQVFDLQRDPHETTNRIAQPEAAAQVPRLMQLMKQWQARVGDKLELPARDTPPAAPDLSGLKRDPDRWQPDWIVKKYFENSP